MVFCYLNSKGFFPARSGTWGNPPLNIFNLAKNGSFLKDLRKKVSKSDWNHMHKLHATQIHHNTYFWPHFCLKSPNFTKKTVIFDFSKITFFGCFLGFWRWNQNSKTSFRIHLTIINALPVKKMIKNVFWENHIFTRFNLLISSKWSIS